VLALRFSATARPATPALLVGTLSGGIYNYGSATPLLEIPETRLAALRTALIEGEQSGPSAAFDIEVFVARKRSSASPASC
jgi:hypothetical protein